VNASPVPAAPLVIAHRGASDALPEHTPAAYRRAIADGADGLECDVRLSADRQLVCVHDARVDRTSSGTGSVASKTLAELDALDWGSWRTGAPGDPDADADAESPADRDGHRLLTLRALLRLARDCGRPLDLSIETKHPSRFGGQVEDELAALLRAEGWLPGAGADGVAPVGGRVRMMSFSGLAVRRMHQLSPQLPLVYLMERVPRVYRDGSLPEGAGIAGIGLQILRESPGYVRRAHAAGHAVHVWTVDEPDDVRRCLDAGVQAIITNRPRQVLDQLGR
jgi:glycerophosphoryl diester phosphodiesterase